MPTPSERAGGSSSGRGAGERVEDVWFTSDSLVVRLGDGRVVSAPLVWYPRLLHASPAQRANWILAGAGYGIHWPELDEDLTVEGLLAGQPAPHGSTSFAPPS
jgi:hypothetical protein